MPSVANTSFALVTFNISHLAMSMSLSSSLMPLCALAAIKWARLIPAATDMFKLVVKPTIGMMKVASAA